MAGRSPSAAARSSRLAATSSSAALLDRRRHRRQCTVLVGAAERRQGARRLARPRGDSRWCDGAAHNTTRLSRCTASSSPTRAHRWRRSRGRVARDADRERLARPARARPRRRPRTALDGRHADRQQAGAVLERRRAWRRRRPQPPVHRLAVAHPQLVGRERARVGAEPGARRPAGRRRRQRARPVRRRRSRRRRRRRWPSRLRPASSACRPTPSELRPPSSSSRSSSRWSFTSAIGSAPGRRGSRSYRPSTSVSSTSRRACSSSATWAASASLSPKVISSVAVESFSLTTGTTPQRSSVSSVRAGVQVAVAAVDVAAVSSTWAAAQAVARRAPRSQRAQEQRLADGGCRLQLGQPARPPLASERAQAQRDRAGADQHDRRAGADQRGHVGGDLREYTRPRPRPRSSTRVLDPILTTTVPRLIAAGYGRCARSGPIWRSIAQVR